MGSGATFQAQAGHLVMENLEIAHFEGQAS
jgi:hypothetical protein